MSCQVHTAEDLGQIVGFLGVLSPPRWVFLHGNSEVRSYLERDLPNPPVDAIVGGVLQLNIALDSKRLDFMSGMAARGVLENPLVKGKILDQNDLNLWLLIGLAWFVEIQKPSK